MMQASVSKKFRDRVQRKQSPRILEDAITAQALQATRKDLLWERLLPAVNIFRQHGEIYMERLPLDHGQIRVEVSLLPFEPSQSDIAQVPAADFMKLRDLGWRREGDMYVTDDAVLLGNDLTESALAH